MSTPPPPFYNTAVSATNLKHVGEGLRLIYVDEAVEAEHLPLFRRGRLGHVQQPLRRLLLLVVGVLPRQERERVSKREVPKIGMHATRQRSKTKSGERASKQETKQSNQVSERVSKKICDKQTRERASRRPRNKTSKQDIKATKQASERARQLSKLQNQPASREQADGQATKGGFAHPPILLTVFVRWTTHQTPNNPRLTRNSRLTEKKTGKIPKAGRQAVSSLL